MVVHEMSTNTSLAPLYAWKPKGERACRKYRATAARTSDLDERMTIEGMGHCVVVVAQPPLVFEAYVEQVLSPVLQEEPVIFQDNLRARKGDMVRRLIDGRGCEVFYLPPYSPNLKWDEKAQIMLRQGPLRCRSDPPRKPRAHSSRARFSSPPKRCWM